MAKSYFRQLKREIGKEKRQERIENRALFNKRVKIYNKQKGIRVGDYIKQKNGKLTRVTYVWRDENGKPLQYQTGGGGGSYYLGNGYMSYSGSLNHGYEANKTKFKKLSTKKKGRIWFFKNNIAEADNSVEFVMDMRVFKVVESNQTTNPDI